MAISLNSRLLPGDTFNDVSEGRYFQELCLVNCANNQPCPVIEHKT